METKTSSIRTNDSKLSDSIVNHTHITEALTKAYTRVKKQCNDLERVNKLNEKQINEHAAVDRHNYEKEQNLLTIIEMQRVRIDTLLKHVVELDQIKRENVRLNDEVERVTAKNQEMIDEYERKIDEVKTGKQNLDESLNRTILTLQNELNASVNRHNEEIVQLTELNWNLESRVEQLTKELEVKVAEKSAHDREMAAIYLKRINELEQCLKMEKSSKTALIAQMNSYKDQLQAQLEQKRVVEALKFNEIQQINVQPPQKPTRNVLNVASPKKIERKTPMKDTANYFNSGQHIPFSREQLEKLKPQNTDDDDFAEEYLPVKNQKLPIKKKQQTNVKAQSFSSSTTILSGRGKKKNLPDDDLLEFERLLNDDDMEDGGNKKRKLFSRKHFDPSWD